MSNNLLPIFISYRSDDLPIAEELRRRLADEKFSVWFDKFRLDPGCDWHKKIEAGCEAARIILPVLTPRWRQSVWTRYETYGAEQIIPLLFEGGFAQVAPPPLQGKQFIDLSQPTEAKWQSLFDKLHEYLALPAPAKKPRLAYLPLGHNEHFVGREALLNEIHEKLHQAPVATLTPSPAHAVAGMGGVGKTTVAREYAEKFWRAYQDILWVNASVASALPGEFAGLALRLGLIAKLSDDTNTDAALALSELSGQTSRLLILDNALDEESVQAWIPKAGACRTIITSRFTAWSTVKTLEIDVLDPVSSRELLLSRSGLPDTEPNCAGADALAKELGYLPLALEQAAAYIHNKGTSFAGYLALYRGNHAGMLAKNELPEGQYPASVAVTWLTSIDQIGPLGKLILTLCSFLAPDSIPRRLIEAAIPILQEAGGDLPPITADALTDALGELFRYSLIRLAPNDGPITIHRLVQTVQCDSLPFDDVRHRWAEYEVILLDSEFPFGDHAQWNYCAALLPHVRRISDWIDMYTIESEEPVNLLNSAGSYLQDRAQYVDAELFYNLAYRICERALGPEHAYTAERVHNIAHLYAEQGRYDEAELLYKKVIKVFEKELDEGNPSLAVVLNNLAEVYRNQSRYADAEPLYKRALIINETALGPTHLSSASNLNNLGIIYKQQGRLSEAEISYLRALDIYVQALGMSHPDTGRALDNIANLYFLQGKYDEAEQMSKSALQIVENALGPDHPRTAQILNNLASKYSEQGKFDQAEPLYLRTMLIYDKTLTIDHPLARQARENYEKLLKRMGSKL